MKNNRLVSFIFGILMLVGCSKNNPGSSGGNGTGGGNGGGGNGGGGNGNNNTTCYISTISQVNSGNVPEFSLSASYNSNNEVTKLVIYDSAGKVKDFEANFNYITPDSVRIDPYQYLILDYTGRVIRFATKSDMTSPQNSDNYLFDYTYNDGGYLVTKNLHINGSTLPNLSTSYNYTNNLLTSCVMTAVSSGNLKVLESNLTYDNSVAIKNWIYTFPDALEGFMYMTVLNFGNRSANHLKQVITRIYNPTTGALLDTWTTNYSNYRVDANGYILYGEANGDLQQGIAAFYGKTNFFYDCH